MKCKRFLKKFNSQNDYDTQKDLILAKPHVALINELKKLIYCKHDTEPSIDYSKEFFTIEALEDGLTASLSTNACEYRIDNGDWNNLSADSNTPSINKGQKLSFKITNPTISDGIGTFTVSKAFNVEGNIMSLLYGDDFIGQIDLSGKDYAFYMLFNNCTTLQNAENLIFPATTLASYCYNGMFYGCISLTTAPELPATELADYCYSSMFSDCTSLTTAPELSATTLAYGCYEEMFLNCTSLTTAPELPATTLASDCYYRMFYGTNVLLDCSNIDFTNEAVVASGGLKGLFSGTKVTDADLERILPKNNEGKYCLPVTTLASECYNGMFDSCTSLTTAPELPATTLAEGCYSNMFYDCTSLTSAPELPAIELADYCYSYMFSNCTSLTETIELPATTLAVECYYFMFRDCTSLTTAPELPATELADYCYYFMFQGCTSLTTAPELLATELASSCYEGMFNGCKKLNNITMLATDISASYCLENWVEDVAETGTFVKHLDMVTLPSGVSGIPDGWIVENA